MKILAIDIETTGLDVMDCQILEFACVLEDTDKYRTTKVSDLPYLRRILLHKKIEGEPVALLMNAELIKTIAQFFLQSVVTLVPPVNPELIRPEALKDDISRFLIEWEITDPVNIIGKNFEGFDSRFLNKMFILKQIIPHHRRIMDPAILFHDPAIDNHLPDSKTCLQRAGLSAEGLHTAVEDARNCIRLYRIAKKYTQVL